MTSEKDPGLTPELSQEKSKEIQETGAEVRKELHEQLEKRAEASHEGDVEKSKQEALEAAAKLEKKTEKEVAPAEKRRDSPSQRKAKAKASYKKTMKETQSQMNAPTRSFSKAIHNPVVEKTSEFIGATVARPNAILAGSSVAFLLSLGLYLFAKYYGYPLSGSEFMASFVLGWMVGLLFDYLRLMITGKKA